MSSQSLAAITTVEFYPQRNSVCVRQSLPFPQAPDNPSSALCLWVSPFWTFQMNRITLCRALCAWPLLFPGNWSRFSGRKAQALPLGGLQTAEAGGFLVPG